VLDEAAISNLLLLGVVVVSGSLLLATSWIVVCIASAFLRIGFVRAESNRLAIGYAKAIAASTVIGVSEETLGLAVYVCDTEGSCTDANHKLCKLFGRSKTDMLGYGWLGSIEEDDRERVRRNWLRSVTMGQPYFERYRINGIEYRTRAYRMQQGRETLYYVGVVERA
jgi:PAS domain S-box-containing protein